MKVNINSTTHVGGSDQETFAEELKDLAAQEIRSAGLDPEAVEIERFRYVNESFEETNKLDPGPYVELEVRPK